MPIKAIMRIYGKRFSVTSCKSKNKKHKCEFYASKKYTHVILDCDAIYRQQKRKGKINDCVFFEQRDTLYVAIVEVKGESYNIDDLKKQFLGGAALAKEILKKSQCSNYKMVPILVSTNFSNRTKAKIMRQMSISIDGKSVPIRLSRCRKSFSDIVIS